MKALTLFSIFIVLFSISACNKDTKDPLPVACFSPSDQIKKPFESISFQNCSENYDRLLWDFGDGVTSDVTYPSHTWAKTGLYETKLTVYRKNKPNSITKNIVIGEKLRIDYAATISNIKEPWASDFLSYTLYLVKGDSARKFIIGKTLAPPLTSIHLSAVDSIYLDDPFASYHIELDIYNTTGKVYLLKTDEIDMINGPKTLGASVKINIGDAIYSLIPIYR